MIPSDPTGSLDAHSWLKYYGLSVYQISCFFIKYFWDIFIWLGTTIQVENLVGMYVSNLRTAQKMCCKKAAQPERSGWVAFIFFRDKTSFHIGYEL